MTEIHFDDPKLTQKLERALNREEQTREFRRIAIDEALAALGIVLTPPAQTKAPRAWWRRRTEVRRQ